jgi:nucleotide-binding universal stress UspA family protein
MLKGIPTTIEVMEGDPAQAILEGARLHQTSLIVMCSHGERRLTCWLFGSVSLKVSRHSPIPVLVFRPASEGNVFSSKTGTVRILVPLDGSARAEQALEPAAQLAHALSPSGNGALHLICVIPYGCEDQEMLVKLAREYLTEIEEKLFTGDAWKSLAVTTSILLGSDVAESLVELAESGKGMEEIEGVVGCDLIAMTTHGRSGMMRWIMGSVTERTLDTSRLPLLVVRVQEKKQPSVKRHKTPSTQENGRLEEEIWHGIV